MIRTEILLRLQLVKDKGIEALRLLESEPFSIHTQAEIRDLVRWIIEELRNEYLRVSPERAQKTMSMFELSVYSPLSIMERPGEFCTDGNAIATQITSQAR